MDNKDTSKFVLDSITFAAEQRVPNYAEKINKRENIITWGEDNLYPEYLLSLMNKSGKHNAIVKGKAAIIGGNGFKKSNLTEEAKEFLKNEFNDEDLEEILAKITYDVEIAGAFALNIIWSKDRETIAQISYINFANVRIGYDVEDKDNTFYLVSDDWSQIRKNPAVRYPAFSTEDRSEASQILFFSEYRPGNVWYAQPEYIPCANWVELEYEVSNFHLRNVQNGFAPSMLMSFNSGVPTEEERDIVTRSFEKAYAGSKNAGKVFFAFAESRDQAPELTPIELNSSDERFIELNKEVENGIFQGHRVTNPSLFGVKTAGQLGGTQELIDSLNIFDTMYATPKQKSYEKIFNMLANINGIAEKLEIEKYKLKMDTTLSIADLLAILESPITYEQKSLVLQSAGYTKVAADNLVKTTNTTI